MAISLFSTSILLLVSSFLPYWEVFLSTRMLIGLAVSGVASVAMTYIGEEIAIPEHMGPEALDKDIKENVYHIENSIKRLMIAGLKNRRPFIDPIRKPISKYIIKEFKNKSQHE
jgi:hypothetical protein